MNACIGFPETWYQEIRGEEKSVYQVCATIFPTSQRSWNTLNIYFFV